ncbi:zinc-dependent alcohol dehydrogenase family protein [uncultured Roseibium sp.]|uniref:zinc-dependent alcohol dehydrogenase family protein n=1 Tax=uncultured Roseibium sp. TaxID=1936171 RepID=UPI002619F59A|nr:zinc-dependent alcohol dehydrogenase family protein [uncultured Roseibium sp.]
MKQAIYKTHGDAAEVIEIAEREPQPLAPGETRVKILRAPINPSDVFQIAGQYGIQPPLPAPAGMEGIGRVSEVNGEGLPAGTLVLLPVPPGTWATEKVFASHTLVPVPEADIDQLSMISVNPATAYLLLTQYVSLQEGDWLIQSAANSAVGRYVTQLAKARGIRVASVVRRESAIADVMEAGADAAFVDGPDLQKRVAAELDGVPVLALDAVAGKTLGRLAATLAPNGVAVLYGGMSGENATLSDASVIFKNVSIRGFWLVHWFQNSSRDEQQQVYAELTALILEGKLNAPVDRIFPLEDIKEALAYTMKGERAGKVLIAPNGLSSR